MSFILLLATRNRKKLKELEDILVDLPLRVKSPEDFPEAPEVEETGSTFEDNAFLKASELASFSGVWTLADDSGLEVEALDGRPGVWSARFAGPEATDEDNRRRLLKELDGIPSEARSARFVCVACLVSPDGKRFSRRGTCEGVILEEEKGEGGFGYDPLFYLPSLEKTMAELQPEEKHRISHRGQALKELRKVIEQVIRP